MENSDRKAQEAIEAFRCMPLAGGPLPQDQLDLGIRPDRTSALPWRGQFTPKLIEILIKTYAPNTSSVICDPFAGSGTTLLEAARLGHGSLGIEINPSAFVLASISALLHLSAGARSRYVARARQIVDAILPSASSDLAWCRPPDETYDTATLRKVVEAADETEVRIILGIAGLTAVGNAFGYTREKIDRALAQIEQVLKALPREANTKLKLGDARATGAAEQSIDLVITSPPYINVFNYHHNYRSAVEALGWDVLGPARSEIGSNRKHRGNRFLTVIQYCIDMSLALSEMQRISRHGARLVLIVGRESNVLRTAFYNGQLVGALVQPRKGLRLLHWQERRFKNRFGKLITEDVITLERRGTDVENDGEYARAVGVAALQEALKRAPEASCALIHSAIDSALSVQASPLGEAAHAADVLFG